MNNKLENMLERLILGLFMALAFATPLIFTSSTAEYYEFPKMFFVYFVGSTIIALFFIKRILFGTDKLRLPGWAIWGYVGAIFISTVFTSHVYTSLWGYYSRFNGGLISYLVFFGLYVVAINFFNIENNRKVLYAVGLSLFPVSLYGIFQITQKTRIFSTLGQPNWLASYIVMVLPLVVGLAVSEKDDLKRYFWIATIIFSFINLWFTSSLSGVVGLVAAFLYLTLSLGKKAFNKWAIIGVSIFLVFGALNFGFIKDRVSDALNISTDPESYNISDSGLIRMGLWKGSISLAISSPKNFLVGTGPETFPYEFPFYRPDFLNYSSEWDFILNKPHNYYLEILVESGIFALVFYLAIIFKTVFGKKEGMNKYLVAGLVGLFATNIFGWPTVYISLLFWMWLALLKKTSS